jgi:hypothetical protein
MEQFGFEKAAVTLRTSRSASDNGWAGMLYNGRSYCFSREYRLHIVDRVSVSEVEKLAGGDSSRRVQRQPRYRKSEDRLIRFHSVVSGVAAGSGSYPMG